MEGEKIKKIPKDKLEPTLQYAWINLPKRSLGRTQVWENDIVGPRWWAAGRRVRSQPHGHRAHVGTVIRVHSPIERQVDAC